MVGPFERTDEGWTGAVEPIGGSRDGSECHVFSDGRWSGPARFVKADRVVVAPASADEDSVSAATHFIVSGSVRPAR